MKITLSKVNFRNFERLQEANYLLTNGLGGYSSLTLASSLTRNDHSLFMACLKAPNHRYNLVRKVDETLSIDNQNFRLSSQEYVNYYNNFDCMFAFESFSQTYLPEFHYRVLGVQIIKTIVMKHDENVIGIKYQINNPLKQKITLKIEPKYCFMAKGEFYDFSKIIVKNNNVSANNIDMYYKSNAQEKILEKIEVERDLFFGYDARDGRPAVDAQVTIHNFEYQTSKESDSCYLIYKLNNNDYNIETLIEDEIKRQQSYIEKAEVKSDLAKQLVRASEQFVVYRESTKTKTIIAGYPFFGDWGRDTMIAMLGCSITTNQFDDAKDILRTFIKYEKKGILPNLFPEHGIEPMYNTIDAALLFIVSVYEYYQATSDLEFIEKEAYNCIQSIYKNYKAGTDYHIKMLDNGLISGGSDLDQLTWMDVRFEDILPTPRQGMAVEINALWYNSLCIIDFFNQLLNIEQQEIKELMLKVKNSFNDLFYDEKKGYLYDCITNDIPNKQIRPNQAYAVGLPFNILEEDKAKKVLLTMGKYLYAAQGMRTLNVDDEQFKKVHTGSLFNRDMAYHQGTVWPFMAGQYFMGMLKYFKDDQIIMNDINKQLNYYSNVLIEGCIGQIAEIYDGYIPTESRGCFAQAWSVSEILRVLKYQEQIQNKTK